MMKERLKKLGESILQGKLLMRLKADKYLPQIVYFFLCATLYIGICLNIESVLHEREKNEQTLTRLHSLYVEESCRLTSLYSVCQVEDMLREMGSPLRIPSDKAEVIE